MKFVVAGNSYVTVGTGTILKYVVYNEDAPHLNPVTDLKYTSNRPSGSDVGIGLTWTGCNDDAFINDANSYYEIHYNTDEETQEDKESNCCDIRLPLSFTAISVSVYACLSDGTKSPPATINIITDPLSSIEIYNITYPDYPTADGTYELQYENDWYDDYASDVTWYLVLKNQKTDEVIETLTAEDTSNDVSKYFKSDKLRPDITYSLFAYGKADYADATSKTATIKNVSVSDPFENLNLSISSAEYYYNCISCLLKFDVPSFIEYNYGLKVKSYVDGTLVDSSSYNGDYFDIDLKNYTPTNGTHTLKVEITDMYGASMYDEYDFEVDRCGLEDNNLTASCEYYGDADVVTVTLHADAEFSEPVRLYINSNEYDFTGFGTSHAIKIPSDLLNHGEQNYFNIELCCLHGIKTLYASCDVYID